MRSAAFALNILLLHLFGDVLSQPLMGGWSITSIPGGRRFTSCVVMMTIGGLLWCGSAGIWRAIRKWRRIA